jgi:hypothetical protein
MTTPADPEQEKPAQGVDLGKSDPAAEAPFDPYRFGKPEHPIPAEYAPPGYTGPTIPAAAPNPYQAPSPWAQPPGSQPGNPFSNPPGTPYVPGQQQPYQYPPPPSGFGPGVPPPPPYHGYAQPRTGNGKAVAALVLGIASIFFCWLSFFDAIFVILGLIFGLIALNESKQPGAPGRGMAIAGLACTVVGAIVATVLTVLIVHAINKCGGLDNNGSSDFNSCVRDHL